MVIEYEVQEELSFAMGKPCYAGCDVNCYVTPMG